MKKTADLHLLSELQMGLIIGVEAGRVHIKLKDAGSASGLYLRSGRYGLGEVGDLVLIDGQQNVVLGRLTEVKLSEKDRQIITHKHYGSLDLDAIGIVQLLGSVHHSDGRVTPGVEFYPRLGDRVFAATHEFVASIPSRMGSGDQSEVCLALGSVNHSQRGDVSISPEKLFGRHCAILGATGGGKSWTTAKIVEECSRYEAKLVILDATGEYRSMRGEHVVHCHLGDPLEQAPESQKCSLPTSSFQGSDFLAIFDASSKLQAPKFRAAIRSLRLARLRPEGLPEDYIQPEGYIKKAEQEKAPIRSLEEDPEISALLDDPRGEFDVSQLPNQIRQECAYPQLKIKYDKWDEEYWGNINDFEYGNCISLITRINSILVSKAFKPVLKDKSKSLIDFISEFLKPDSRRVLRICLSDLSYEFKAREIIVNCLGRYFLDKARDGAFTESPLVLFVDEAHNFLGRTIGTEETIARLDAFELIAREGRKYGLNICLATQRPRDLTLGVLSQVGTLVVHRLTNDRDREVVERACGEIDRSASAFLPNLKEGEAVIIGVDMPIPLTIQIQEPTFRPKSDGPDYQTYWSSVGEDEAEG